MTDIPTTYAHPNFSIRLEQPSDADAIEALLDQAFGQNRETKTTYRFRDGVRQRSDLCFVALDKTGRLVGAIRFWPVQSSLDKPTLLLGPLAVDENFLGFGCGLALMEAGINQARKAGEELIILVGDEIYYGKVGFVKTKPDHFQFPGPVDPDRILALELVPSSLEKAAGALRPL